MSKTDEKLADIAAEIRAARNAASDTTLVSSDWLDDWATRIERAANNLESSFGMALAIEDGLRKRDKQSVPGNAAAMREALEFAEDELWAHGAFDSSKRVAAALAAPNEPLSDATKMRAALNELDIDAHRMRWDGKFRDKREAENFVERVIDTIRRALAAPARNCDRYATAKDALDAFIREKEIKSADVDNMSLRDFFDWLFDMAEGGAKCVNGLRGEPDCRGCNEHCEDVRKRNCFYWNPDIEGGVCSLTGKKSCPISCDNFHVPEKVSPPPAEGAKE